MYVHTSQSFQERKRNSGYEFNMRIKFVIMLYHDLSHLFFQMSLCLEIKLKAQKEKLESKELHMNLLRQKITQLEEEKQVRAALAVERDEANLAVRKLHKMIERLQKQLDLARETNTDLKAKLSETSELKVS